LNDPLPNTGNNGLYDTGAMVADSQGRPVVAVSEGYRPEVKVWMNREWQSIGAGFQKDNHLRMDGIPIIALSRTDVPTLVFTEDDRIRGFLKIVGLNR
jgi:hypothetical protein